MGGVGRLTSMPTILTLAWPCLPVLEVDMSTILHGRPRRGDRSDRCGSSTTKKSTFYDDETVFTESRALHGISEGSSSAHLDKVSINAMVSSQDDREAQKNVPTQRSVALRQT